MIEHRRSIYPSCLAFTGDLLPDRDQAVGKSFQLKVIIQAYIGIRTRSADKINRPFPVVMGQDVKHYQVVL